MKHPLIIGAGGVASYLLPALLKTFRPEALTIIDKDVLEERNLDRQLFSPEWVGEPKVKGLLAAADLPETTQVTPIFDWFSETTTIPESVDAIICVADNHEARNAALLRADQLGIMCYIGGNEYVDSQAYAYHTDWRGTKRDPRTRYPEITTSHEGSPFRCTGEAQEIHPQLASANFGCAAKLLHLLWVYERWLPENRSQLSQQGLDALPYELFTSLFENSSL